MCIEISHEVKGFCSNIHTRINYRKFLVDENRLYRKQTFRGEIEKAIFIRRKKR